MVNHVYKIKYSKSSLELNEDYQYLSDFEKEAMAELNAISFFDYDDDLQKYTCYIITTPLEIKKYSKILSNNLILHDFYDLSEDILLSKIDIEKEVKDKINSFNFLKYDFFIEDIDEWLLENLNIDIVLDRINEVGIDSLKDIEKEFLKHYSND
jgi:hypothetical protein